MLRTAFSLAYVLSQNATIPLGFIYRFIYYPLKLLWLNWMLLRPFPGPCSNTEVKMRIVSVIKEMISIVWEITYSEHFWHCRPLWKKFLGAPWFLFPRYSLFVVGNSIQIGDRSKHLFCKLEAYHVVESQSIWYDCISSIYKRYLLYVLQ